MIDSLSFTGLGARVGSALIAASLVVGIAVQFGALGLQVASIVTTVLVTREYARLAFSLPETPLTIRWCFIGFAFFMFLSFLTLDSPFALILSLCSLFYSLCLWLTRNRVSNEKILSIMNLGTMGFLWCIIFPGLEIYTLRLQWGTTWFFLHLLVVFSGDIAAYFGGRWWGKTPLMSQVSPKKTMAGSYSGLLGSLVTAAIFAHFTLPYGVFWPTLVFALLCGFVAQMGDLSISLLKRVAQIKDSGRLMPGHGGILDRLDGVLMSSPLIYGFAQLALHTTGWINP